MAFQYKVVTVTCPASTGTTSISGLGFTPKGMIIFGTRTSGTQGLAMKINLGVDDLVSRKGKSTNPGTFVGAHAADSYQRDDYSFVNMRTQGLNEIMCLGYVSAVNSDGFDVTWDFVLVSTGAKFYALVFGGTGINVKAGTYTAATGTSTAYTGVGFKPTGVFSFHGGGSSALLPGDGTCAYGATGNELCGQVASGGSYESFPAGGITNCNHYQTEDEWVTLLDNAGPVLKKTVLTTLDNLGFTVNNISGNGTYAYLAVNGCSVNVGTFTQQAGTGAQTIPITSGSPKCAIIFGANKVSHPGTVVEDFFISIGAGDVSVQKSIWAGALRGVSSERANSVEEENYIIRAETPTGNFASTMNSRAALTALNPEEMVINWETNDGVAREWCYMVFGDDLETGPCGALPDVPTGTVIVVKDTDPSGSAAEFDFTCSEDLGVTSFTLSDGESRTFTDVPVGSGYSVVEDTYSQWETSYTVSSGELNTNFTVLEDQTITITVLNERRFTPSGETIQWRIHRLDMKFRSEEQA